VDRVFFYFIRAFISALHSEAKPTIAIVYNIVIDPQLVERVQKVPRAQLLRSCRQCKVTYDLLLLLLLLLLW
jgi:hypothetical protein